MTLHTAEIIHITESTNTVHTWVMISAKVFTLASMDSYCIIDAFFDRLSLTIHVLMSFLHKV